MKLERIAHTEQGTFGILSAGSLSLFTVEDPWLDNAVGESCIPLGAYKVVRHATETHPDGWLVLDVPGRSAIMIHVGNTIDDTQGCILPGKGLGYVNNHWAVTFSNDAMEELTAYLEDVNEFMLYVMEADPYHKKQY
jgi:hypothetical protein